MASIARGNPKKEKQKNEKTKKMLAPMRMLIRQKEADTRVPIMSSWDSYPLLPDHCVPVEYYLLKMIGDITALPLTYPVSVEAFCTHLANKLKLLNVRLFGLNAKVAARELDNKWLLRISISGKDYECDSSFYQKVCVVAHKNVASMAASMVAVLAAPGLVTAAPVSVPTTTGSAAKSEELAVESLVVATTIVGGTINTMDAVHTVKPSAVLAAPVVAQDQIFVNLGTDEKQELKSKAKKTWNIGIDFGGVLSVHERKLKGKDNNNAEHINTSVDMPGAVECLKKLVAAGNRLYLVSYCGRERAIATEKSMVKSGIAALFVKLVFVDEPTKKKFICEEYGIEIMIDDSLKNLTDIGTYLDKCKLIHFKDIPGYGWEKVMATSGLSEVPYSENRLDQP